MAEKRVLREELQAALEARKELGEEMVLASMAISVPLFAIVSAR